MREEQARKKGCDDADVQVIVTNTIPIHPERSFPQLTVLSVASVIADTIFRMYNSSAVQPQAFREDWTLGVEDTCGWKNTSEPTLAEYVWPERHMNVRPQEP